MAEASAGVKIKASKVSVFFVSGYIPHYIVGVSDEPPDGAVDSYKICRNLNGVQVVQDLACEGGDRIGRHVIIQVPGQAKILRICEVQVYGFIPGKNRFIPFKKVLCF